MPATVGEWDITKNGDASFLEKGVERNWSVSFVALLSPLSSHLFPSLSLSEADTSSSFLTSHSSVMSSSHQKERSSKFVFSSSRRVFPNFLLLTCSLSSFLASGSRSSWNRSRAESSSWDCSRFREISSGVGFASAFELALSSL